jgi:hypothetical protein
MSVITEAVHLLGGYGYVNDYPVERNGPPDPRVERPVLVSGLPD